jgi:hypothetical protein
MELTEKLRQADLLNQQNIKVIADLKGEKLSPLKKVGVPPYYPTE